MEDNLIHLFRELATVFLNLPDENSGTKNKYDEKNCVKTICQKAFDVIYFSRCEKPHNEGCVEWYPEILISDYGYHLMHEGATHGSSQLFESLCVLNESEFSHLDEILSFLLKLKGPYAEDNVFKKHPFSLSGDDFFFHPVKPYDLLPNSLFSVMKSDNQDVSLLKPTDDLFLDSFIEKRKANILDTSTSPTLHDFINSSISKSSVKKREIKRSYEVDVSRKTSSPVKRVSLSDIENSTLGVKNCLIQVEDELKERKFVDDYELKLERIEKSPFKRGVQQLEISEKPKRLALGIYLEDSALKKLMETNHITVIPIEITLEHYISQVKYLLCGLSSCIFKYDEKEKKFFIKVGTYVDGISPDVMFEMSKVYLKTGTYFKNLTAAAANGVCSGYGVIYPAFWKSVQDYLQRHCDAVAAIPEVCSLMVLKLTTADLQDAMATVHRLCLPEVGGLPSGGLLMTYLFEYCYVIQQQYVQKAIFTILYDCCIVYYSKLVEKWVFQGCLDNPLTSDMFIRVNGELSSHRDRSCYLSVTVDEATIPSFLRGLASRIFACGKAMWLLKLFDPENKFIYFVEAMKNPKIHLCTSETEFKQLEREFSDYENVITKLCGEKVSFITIKENELEKGEEHCAKIKLMQEEALKKLEKIKAQKYEIQRKKYEQQALVLKSQQEAIAQKKKKIKDEKEAERKANEFILEGKKEILQHYQSLAETAENIRARADWRTKRLEMQDKRVEFLKQDLINENALLDEEGNVISTELDVENANVIGENLDNQGDILATTNEIITIEDAACEEGNKNNNRTVKEDTINSAKSLSDALNNRAKVLGSSKQEMKLEFSEDKGSKPITEATRNKMKILGTEIGEEVKENEAFPQKYMTDAMKNKTKVLGTEYYLPDASEKTLTKTSTDAIKNRIKVMGTEINTPETISNSEICPMHLTEAQRNKLKVLGTEYNLPLEPKKENLGPLSDLQKNRIRMNRSDVKNLVSPTENESLSLSYKNNSTDCHKSDKVQSSNTTPPTEDLSIKSEKHQLLSFDVSPTSPLKMFSSIPQISAFDMKIVPELELTMFARYLQRSINIAVTVQERLANSAVIKHFLLQEKFMAHISSIRCYFLLYDGEFSRNLTHGLFQSLALCSESHQFFDRSSLSGILNEALIYTNPSSQRNAQNLSFQIVKMPTTLKPESYDVLTPFQLSYKVKWPLNIIITDISLDRYRKIFHVLVNLKRVHWTLNETFLLLKTQTKGNSLDGKLLMNSPEYTKLATYRHAMTLFIITLEEHMCANGLQEAWSDFSKQLETVSDLDHLYQKHVAFVKDVCRRCFLVKASQDLLSYINEMIELGLSFHYVLKSCTWRLINQIHYGHPKFSSLKSIFKKFCDTTIIFNKTLRKKTRHPEMKIHVPLLELFDLKIKV